jgi:hypothetical protein
VKLPHFAALAMLGAAIPLWLGEHVSLPPRDAMHDQLRYLAMTGAEVQPPADPRAAPFGWRLLPSAIVRASRLPATTGFHVLTLIALALIPPAAALMLAAAGASAVTALGAVMVVAPPVAGYLSWDFIRPDGVSLLLIFVSAWAAIRARPAMFLVTLAALSLTKETWVVSAAFALLWTRAYQPVFFKWAVWGTVLALVVAAGVRIAIPSPQPYSFVTITHDLYWPLDGRTVARRLLLATGATWNVLLPLAALALARRIREPRAWAVTIAVLLASAQILVAIDTQRVVAAAYPFVLLACAWELDRLPPRTRISAGILIAIAQVPWLLTYARLATLPLRGVELALAALTLAALVYGVRVGPPAAGTGATAEGR